jgi:hypothetical protein
MDQEMMNKSMRVSDARCALMVLIDKNERPYKAATQKFNNDLVEQWYEQVLKKICDREGMIKAGQVMLEWQTFYDGKTTSRIIHELNEGTIERPSKKCVDHWVKIFTEYDVSGLMKLGQPAVGLGWRTVVTETFLRNAQDKWDIIYSKSNDPLEWRKLANDNPKLWNSEHVSPFWGDEILDDVNTKVATVLSSRIEPRQ